MDDRGELPAEIHRVADAGVPPLAGVDRHHVRSVARNEDAALAPLGGDAGVVGVDASADDGEAVGVGDVATQQVLDEGLRLGQLDRLVVVEHELPAPDRVRQAERGPRPDRVGTEDGVRGAQRVVLDVDDQDALLQRDSRELGADPLAGEGAAALRADEVVGGDGGRLAAVHVAEGGNDVVAAVVDPDELRPQSCLGAREPVEPGEQDTVDQRLDEPVAPGPAELVGLRVHLRDDGAAPVHRPHHVVRDGVGQHLVDQLDRLHGAQRLVIDADGTGVVDEVVEALHDERRDVVATEHVAEGQSGRTGTHHEDLDVRHCAHPCRCR